MAKSKLNRNLKVLQDYLGWLIVAVCLILIVLYLIAGYLGSYSYYLQAVGIAAIAAIVMPKNKFPHWAKLFAIITLCLFP